MQSVKEFSEFNAGQDNAIENDHLADFYRRIGGRVILLKSGLWVSRGARIFEPVLMKGPLDLSAHDIDQLWRGGSLFIRYPVPPDQIGTKSYIHIVDDKGYDLDSLHGNQRKETRRSLRLCHVEKIPISYVIKHGLDLVLDTYLRQERYIDEHVLGCWKKYLEVGAENPLFEAWGAFVGKQLGAFRVDFSYRGGFYGEPLFSRRDLLKYQVMNALMFVSTREVIRRPEIDHVSYGLRAIFGDIPSLVRFKESLGYKRVEVVERIEMAPKLRLFRPNLVCKFGRKVLGKYCDKSDKAKRVHALLGAVMDQRKMDSVCAE